MNRLVLVFASLLAASGCERAIDEPATATAAEERDDTLILENDNLLNMVFGAAIVDRDNEAHLEVSAASAIDGTAMSVWEPAPGGTLQTVISLAAPTRLERIGAAMAATKSKTPATLRVATSLDGASWSRPAEHKLTFASAAPQLFDIQPVVARYLRVEIDNPNGSPLLSLHARGRETAPFVQPPLEGCWEINGEPARFTRSGARILGTIGPVVIDGGTDGRVYRLMWLEPPMWGYAAMSISADGRHLSGVRWHEEVSPKNNGGALFGSRVPCTANDAFDGAKIVDALIGRTAMWRMYGVRFDRQDRILDAESAAALDLAAKLVREHPGHRFRIVAREFRAPSEAQNRARCAAKLASMRKALETRGADLSRIEFVSAGTARSELSVDFTTQRVMDSGVDLEVVAR